MYRALLLSACLVLVRSEYKYDTKWFQVPLDHFAWQRNETFNIKYLVNEDNWDRNGGPIFFYTGNEGQIEVFAKHTGFMWEIAPQFKAKLVFAEHRYYGQSMPFGNKSLDNEYIGYLTSEQALADYADLISFLQGDYKQNYPVIAFGGSYGGMLAAYIRMKYPHLVAGAVAASAPINMFPGMAPCQLFSGIVTSSFIINSKGKCVDNIRRSWPLLRTLSTNATRAAMVKTKWNLCQNVTNATDVDELVDFLVDMYTSLAMVNYPFPSDFLQPLPAYPVRSACQYLNVTLKDDQLLEAIGKVARMYTDYNGKGDCMHYKDASYANLDASGWNYQACTEMVMPMCQTGDTDMFEPVPWNFTEYADGCHKKYGVSPRLNAARVEYGGDRLKAASNIVFSNGLRDPWTAGGILTSKSDTVVAIVIVDGAHHLDLMPSSPNDPPTVRAARDTHRRYINQWIRQFNMT